MKSIDVEIKHFGKIKHAEFAVKPFTVIAGKNASGKSFVTRALYSIFSSLNKDHLSIEFDECIFRIRRLLSNAYIRTLEVDEILFNIKLVTDRLAQNIDVIFHQSTLISQIAQKDILSIGIQQLKQLWMELEKNISSIEEYSGFTTYFEITGSTINKLEMLVKAPHLGLEVSLLRQLDQSFIGNFQVNALSKLKNKEATQTDKVSFNFGTEIGHLTLEANQLQFELEDEGIDAFQQIDNVVYLESPIYWKIKDVLKGWVASQNDPSLRRKVKHQQKALKKVPEYILDTFELLDTEIAGYTPNDALVQVKEAINQCIGGHIQISDSGDLQFNHQTEQGAHYAVDLHHTATGATSLGIIALLLEKNVIVPNSVLIFDEPEVNLHPAWQQVMIQVLYKLSLAGVRIVMASHSFDMIENIEKLMDLHDEKGDDVNQHFSILQLDNGVSINHKKPIFKKLGAVKADLGMPLFNLFSDL